MVELRLEGQVGVGQLKRGGKGISINGSTLLVKDKLSRHFQKCCSDRFFSHCLLQALLCSIVRGWVPWPRILIRKIFRHHAPVYVHLIITYIPVLLYECIHQKLEWIDCLIKLK